MAYIKAVLVAVVAGLAFIYGNDYGIAVWVCLTSIFFLVIFTVEKDFLKACLTFVLYLCTSFLTIFFAVLIITSGNFSDWYSVIFDVGTYQKWYYGVNAHSNNYIWNIDTSPVCLLAVILAALYIVLLFINRKNMQYAIGRYGIPAFLNMVAYTVANEYKLISGGGLHEVLSIVVWTTLVTELINLILKGISKFQVGTYWVWVKRCGLIFMIIAMITVSINRSLAYHKNIAADKNRSIYVESLGGYLNNGTYSNIVKAAKILNGEAIFSTYASAIEVYTNQFQPTGTDYIIHVLGDSNRDRYLENFKNNNYKYASTINNGYNAWEYWIKNANWFFYRELYKKYCPLYRTSYNVIWKENTAEENCSEEKLDTKVIYNEKSSVTIRVTTKSNITGIADILLKWKVETEDNLASKFIFNPTVHVQCVTSQMFSKSLRDTFNLGKEGTTWVPIQIINGEGEIVLTSNPAENTSLNIIDASADCLYTVENYWLHIKNLKQNNTQCIFILDNNDNNLTALKNTETIKYDSVQYAILGISIDEKNIYLYIDGSAYNNISSKFHENNYLKVEK